MIIHFSFNVMLLIAGILTGLLTILILVTEKANKEANRYLAALVMICIGVLLHNFLLETNIYNTHPFLYFLPVIFSLGIGPMLYLYVNRLTGLKKIDGNYSLLHLLPAIIQGVTYLICFIQSIDDKYAIYTGLYQPLIDPLQTITTYISVGIYGYLSFKTLARFRSALSAFYANGHLMALHWLNRLLFVFLAYYALSVVFILIAYLFKITVPIFPADFIRCLIIFTIAFFAIKQNSLVIIQRNIQSVTGDLDNGRPATLAAVMEPAQPAIPPKEINTVLLQQIIALVENEQLYLNEELTVADLGAKLGYSARTISYTLNNGLQKSFSLFINEYRIRLFKERKLSGQFDHLSIMGLAYDCGFNSKSTFNRMYKEITGGAPKDLQAPVQ